MVTEDPVEERSADTETSSSPTTETEPEDEAQAETTPPQDLEVGIEPAPLVPSLKRGLSLRDMATLPQGPRRIVNGWDVTEAEVAPKEIPYSFRVGITYRGTIAYKIVVRDISPEGVMESI